MDGSSEVGDQEPNFFRKFSNQTRDPAEAVFDEDESHLDTRDLQPEMFSIEERSLMSLKEAVNVQNSLKKAFCPFMVT